jgi:hypothetical protein
MASSNNTSEPDVKSRIAGVVEYNMAGRVRRGIA